MTERDQHRKRLRALTVDQLFRRLDDAVLCFRITSGDEPGVVVVRYQIGLGMSWGTAIGTTVGEALIWALTDDRIPRSPPPIT